MKWVVIILLLTSCSSTRTVTLDGSKSFDPDGKIVQYDWRKISGGPMKIESPRAVITTVMVKKGRYVVELKVTDNHGAVGMDTAIINK